MKFKQCQSSKVRKPKVTNAVKYTTINTYNTTCYSMQLVQSFQIAIFLISFITFIHIAWIHTRLQIHMDVDIVNRWYSKSHMHT